MESVAIASAAGFLGIDIRLNTFADDVEESGVESLKSAMEDAGLRPGYSSITPQKIAVSEADWLEGMAGVPRRAAFAERLGYTRATSVMLPFSDGLDFETYDALHVARIREACDALAPFGISFGVEYISPLSRRKDKPTIYIHTLGQTLELLDRVNRPNVGLMLDSFHWYCAGETEDDIATIDPSRIVAVHLNDLVPDRPIDEQVVTERLLPGESGMIDLDAFIRGLARSGYEGPLTCEPTHDRWRGMDPADAAKKTCDSIRLCLEAARATP
ncbi:MAG: sugar phosphate isomerase/epimerase family protein [Planctomycetota bacterium]